MIEKVSILFNRCHPMLCCTSVRMLLLLLSHFSRVWLCATPQTAAHQAPRPWDSPGKNTGVGCHFLLQCMKVKSESKSLRLLRPWDFPGKSTGVGCHCLLPIKVYTYIKTLHAVYLIFFLSCPIYSPYQLQCAVGTILFLCHPSVLFFKKMQRSLQSA